MPSRAALALAFGAAAGATIAGAVARADELPPPPARPPAQMPYAIPRETLIPGTPGMAGGIHLMVNAFGLLQNQRCTTIIEAGTRRYAKRLFGTGR
jgi:hypothetical protein